jgi:hypothetical protein
MLPFSSGASLIYVDNDLKILIVKRIRNVRIIGVVGRLRYEYHMSISANASFELEGCSYLNLDDHRMKGRTSY